MFLFQTFFHLSFSTILPEQWLMFNSNKWATSLARKYMENEPSVTYLFTCSTMYREVGTFGCYIYSYRPSIITILKYIKPKLNRLMDFKIKIV